MNQTLQVKLLGARHSSIDGRSFCSVFILQDAEGDSDAGIIPMKLSCEPKLFLELRSFFEANGAPAAALLQTTLKTASGGGMKMHVVGLGSSVSSKPVNAGGKTSAVAG